ncbi:protein phosphatase 2C domain-containing protein [Streptomyces sp. NPDC048623]|uniref:protein phosphatase 2C domain-containing protein n=1 Tax=Streptomyces sp. NPDC048623 TaxID=3155761 RepID=UPI00343594BA
MTPARRWRVHGISAVGYRHLRDRTPCQDAWRYRETPGGLVLAVADGAGSAERSGEGARAAVDLAVEAFAPVAAPWRPGDDPRERRELLTEAFREVRADFLTWCAGPPGPFATTLTVVVAAEGWLGQVSIGDGLVLVRAKAGAAPETGSAGGGAHGPGGHGPGSPEAGAHGPGAHGPGAPRAGVPGTGAYGPEAHGPGAPRAGVPGTEAYGPGGHGAAAPRAGAPGRGVPGSGAHGTGAPAPGVPATGAPSVGQPGTGALDTGAPRAGAHGTGAPSAGPPGYGAPGSGAYGSGGPRGQAADTASPAGPASYHLLPQSHTGSEYANETVFLGSPTALGQLRVDCVRDPRIDGVLLSTDGLTHALLRRSPSGPPLPHDAFLGHLFERLGRDGYDHDEEDRRLAEFLASDQISRVTGDDKTLLWAIRHDEH